MGKLLFELSDDDRAALERVRIKMGLRSHAETLRAMISEADSGRMLTAAGPIPAQHKAIAASTEPRRPIVSRLKGEWKPK